MEANVHMSGYEKTSLSNPLLFSDLPRSKVYSRTFSLLKEPKISPPLTSSHFGFRSLMISIPRIFSLYQVPSSGHLMQMGSIIFPFGKTSMILP